MFVIISTLLSLIGTIGLMIGFYKLIVKKEKAIGNHILAYSYFIMAVSDVMSESYIMMMIFELIAIACFRDYIHEKEAK